MKPIACFAAASLLVSCAGSAAAPPLVREGGFKPRSIDLPRPVNAIPVARVEPRGSVGEKQLRKLERLPGVRVIAEVAVEKTALTTATRRVRLRVGVVRPLDLRPATPPSTRDAEFVWTSLVGGKAVVSFKAADRLGLETTGEFRIRNSDPIPIGAFADTGVPNFADVVLNRTVGERLGITRPRLLLVAARPSANPSRVVGNLREVMPGARVVRLFDQPETPAGGAAPIGEAQGQLIGEMHFRILKNGFIEPDPAWVAENIASGEVPILGTVTCHRLVLPQLGAALGELSRRGLADLIDTAQYGGCYVPRFIDRDPRRALSMHAFGLALDLNVSTNHLGTRGDMDPRVVEVFERWGFGWGGRWSTPDPMHFELVRLVRV